MTTQEFEKKQSQVLDIDLISNIERKLEKLCKTGGRSLSMSVPPSVNDLDMSISELIKRYKQCKKLK